MPPTVERKLAAILSADVVGYSRLMAEDEEATVRRLKQHREIIDRLGPYGTGRTPIAGFMFLFQGFIEVQMFVCPRTDLTPTPDEGDVLTRPWGIFVR